MWYIQMSSARTAGNWPGRRIQHSGFGVKYLHQLRWPVKLNFRFQIQNCDQLHETFKNVTRKWTGSAFSAYDLIPKKTNSAEQTICKNEKCIQPPNSFSRFSLVQYTLHWGISIRERVDHTAVSKYNQSTNNPLALQTSNKSNWTSGPTQGILVNERPEKSTRGFHLEFTACLLVL